MILVKFSSSIDLNYLVDNLFVNYVGKSIEETRKLEKAFIGDKVFCDSSGDYYVLLSNKIAEMVAKGDCFLDKEILGHYPSALSFGYDDLEDDGLLF